MNHHLQTLSFPHHRLQHHQWLNQRESLRSWDPLRTRRQNRQLLLLRENPLNSPRSSLPNRQRIMSRRQHRLLHVNRQSYLPNSLRSNKKMMTRLQHQLQRENLLSFRPKNSRSTLLSKGNQMDQQRHHPQPESLQSSLRSNLRNPITATRLQRKHGDLLQCRESPRQ